METIVDTNLILDNPNILLEVENVIVPLSVIEELDKLKRDERLGYYAREATRIIYENDIVCLLDNYNFETDNILVELSKSGYKILTRDLNLYLKCKWSNGNTEFYQGVEDELYEGVVELVDNDIYMKLRENDKVKVDLDLYENQFVDFGGLIARYNDGYLSVIEQNGYLMSKEKLNRRQVMVNNLLYDKDITVVGIAGEQGTGKTTLAIESAINQLEKGIYDKCILLRPLVNKGGKYEDVGYLPGCKQEKIQPYLQPFWDVLKNRMQNLEQFEMESIGFLQGRSFDNSLLIVTESQNIDSQEMEGIVGRLGKDSKIVFEGDIKQVNRSDLNSNYNGLSHVINTLKSERLAGSVLLDKVERSETAELARKLRIGRN
ncbi:MAG: PhoH family protein [bacterium]